MAFVVCPLVYRGGCTSDRPEFGLGRLTSYFPSPPQIRLQVAKLLEAKGAVRKGVYQGKTDALHKRKDVDELLRKAVAGSGEAEAS